MNQDFNLSGFLSGLSSLEISKVLSDDALIALSVIHLRMYNLVVCTDMEAEYGSRSLYGHCLDELYKVCRCRCERHYSLSRRVRMLPVLQQLVCNASRPAPVRKTLVCERYTLDMVSSFRESLDKRMSKLTSENLSQSEMLQCAEQWYAEAILFPETIADDCSLKDFLCTHGTEWINKTLKQSSGTADDCRLMFLLYELAHHLAGAVQEQTSSGESILGRVDEIVRWASRQLSHFPQDNAGGLLCRSICISDAILKLSLAIQQEALFHSIA